MVKLSGLLGFVESEDSRFVDVVGLVLISVSLGPVVLYGLLSGRRVLDGSLGRASVGGGFFHKSQSEDFAFISHWPPNLNFGGGRGGAQGSASTERKRNEKRELAASEKALLDA